jgi:prephenate dehydratase
MYPHPIETVAYPGREGAHTFQAAEAMFPDAELRSLPSFRALAGAVAAGEVDAGVLPMESSLAGSVAETHDLLFESPLSVIGQTVLPIEHCLAGPAAVPLTEIRTIHSHPMALDQCRDLLARLPQAKVILSATTAEAGQHVAEDGDPTEAAIVGAEAVSLYGLTVLADDVSDSPAFTRFVSIAPYTRIDRVRAARTAFTFATHHKPGALHAAIEPIARAGLDLVRLVSRPLPATPWKYRFDAVVVGHPLEPAVRVALKELEAVTHSLRVVGVYEGHPEEAT